MLFKLTEVNVKIVCLTLEHFKNDYFLVIYYKNLFMHLFYNTKFKLTI